MAATSGTYTIDDPNAIVEGKTIAQWTQDWWTWALQSPAHQNALDDTTGQYANVGNGDHRSAQIPDHPGVFFIAGTTGGDATRTFTVPQGEALLVPMLNTFDTLVTESEAQAYIKGWRPTVKDVFASIDGTPIAHPTRYLEAPSDFFSMGSVRPNTFATEIGALKGQELTPTLVAGYYLMIEGLSPGQHTLEFGGSTNTGFSTHVVDHITVV